MPFQSQAQRGFMYSQHPEIAKEFEAKTPKGKKLPQHKKKHSKAQQDAISRRLSAKGQPGGKGSGRN